MIFSALMLMFAVAALLQPTNERRLSALTYITPIIIFDTWCAGLSDWMLYVGAGLLGWLSVEFISRYCFALTRPLIELCAVSIGLNLFGFIIWYLGFPPTSYEYAFVVLYGLALIILTRGSGHVVGNIIRDVKGRGDDRRLHRRHTQSLQLYKGHG